MSQSDALQAWGDDVPLRGEGTPKDDGRIKFLIQYLLTVHKRFGNTVVTTDLQWGATAFRKRDEQKERIAQLEAELVALRAAPPSSEAVAVRCRKIVEERGDEWIKEYREGGNLITYLLDGMDAFLATLPQNDTKERT